MKWPNLRPGRGLAFVKLTVLALALWTIAGEVWPETMPRPANIARALIDAGTPNRLLYNASGTGLVTDLPAITASRVLISDASGLPTQNAAITASRALASDASGFPTASATTSTELGFLSGVTSAIQTQINNLRPKLTGNRNYFVNASLGNDSNTCLSSGAGACATIQKAVDLAKALDFGGFTVTISVADGTYAHFAVDRPMVGVGPTPLTITGNTGTPANVVISTSASHAVFCSGGTRLSISGVTVTTSVAGGLIGLYSQGWNTQISASSIRFGAVTGSHMQADSGASIILTGSYTIAGNATAEHITCAHQSQCRISSGTVTLSGTPTFSIFANAYNLSYLEFNTVTFSGSGTCTRYSVTGNAVLNTFGGGATYLPCGTAGATGTGGQYL